MSKEKSGKLARLAGFGPEERPEWWERYKPTGIYDGNPIFPMFPLFSYYSYTGPDFWEDLSVCWEVAKQLQRRDTITNFHLVDTKVDPHVVALVSIDNVDRFKRIERLDETPQAALANALYKATGGSDE